METSGVRPPFFESRPPAPSFRGFCGIPAEGKREKGPLKGLPNFPAPLKKQANGGGFSREAKGKQSRGPVHRPPVKLGPGRKVLAKCWARAQGPGAGGEIWGDP